MADIDIGSIEKYLIESTIPASRNYWLVRTLGGSYYTSFRQNNYIALGHNEISLRAIEAINIEAKGNERLALNLLYKYTENIYKDEKRPGFIASQIHKFIYHIKENDVVIIPSDNSETVSFGYIKNTKLLDVSEADIKRTECPYIKRKAVVWEKFLKRDNLDPYLYRVFSAHQAINDIGEYGDIIEGTIRNFYIKNGVTNLVLDVGVEKGKGINAKNLFDLGSNLFDYTKTFLIKNGIPLDIEDIEIKINLNSPGKIQFLSKKSKSIILIVSVIIVAIAGGGLKLNIPDYINLDLSTKGLLQAISDYENEKHDRDVSDKIIREQLDSLKIKSPDDALKLLQQFNTNKNLPK